MIINGYYSSYYYRPSMGYPWGFYYPQTRSMISTYENPIFVPLPPCQVMPVIVPPVIKRQGGVKGVATWTKGGEITKCGIPWTYNNSMTAAAGDNSPYKCGQVLKIKNLSVPEPKEVLVVVVDEVKGFPPNTLNLHEKAFEALGSQTSIGTIKIEIVPVLY